jgi:hypothetical protein
MRFAFPPYGLWIGGAGFPACPKKAGQSGAAWKGCATGLFMLYEWAKDP